MSRKQPTHQMVLTVRGPSGDVITWTADVAPNPGSTRSAILDQAFRQMTAQHPNLAGGAVLHFSLERAQV